MAKQSQQKKSESPVAVAEVEPERESRVDEFAIEIFEHLGFKGRLPDSLAMIYNEFKRNRDTLSPRGRLSSECFATIVTIHRLLDTDR